MRNWILAVAASAAIGITMPAELLAQGNSNRGRQQSTTEQMRERMRQAQQRAEAQRQREREEQRQRGTIRRDDDRYERARRDRDRYDGRYDDRRWDDRRYDDRSRRNGPAFCRSGEGHPVFGRQWCRDKGYSLGRERTRDIWGDIIYRQPRDRRYDNRTLSRGTLGDILGSVVLGRFDSYGRSYYGNSGSLNGRWLDNRGSTLQLYMGRVPIARLVDTNFDGRVDNVILAR